MANLLPHVNGESRDAIAGGQFFVRTVSYGFDLLAKFAAYGFVCIKTKDPVVLSCIYPKLFLVGES